MPTRLGLLLTISALALHCNTDGGGNPAGQAGASSGAGSAGHPPTTAAGAGQSSATAGRGGSTATAGTGGSIARAGSGASGAGGTKASAGRSGAGAISGAGSAGIPAENGGADTGTSGGAGADTGPAGAGGSDDAGPKEVVNDDATLGHGACEGVTLGDVIDAIHQGWPNLASIMWFYDPKTSGEGDSIQAFRTDRGFDLVFFHGSGDCPGGCIDREYWYFETDGSCVPQLVGHYSKTFDDAHNCSRYEGEPLWGVPVGAQGGACP